MHARPNPRVLLLAVHVSATLVLTACSKPAGAPAAPAVAADPSEPRRYPLKGVIVDIQPAQSALLVKHEDIPGFMPGMTMLFKVDAATLKSAAKNQTITATLVPRGEELWLENVKSTAPQATPP